MAAELPADLKHVDPGIAWAPWQPSAQQPFNTQWAAHLYRRAAFGATPAELAGAEKAGLNATLDRLLTGKPEAARRAELLHTTGNSFAQRGETDSLRGWWLYAMLHSGQPVREKLTLFWHNHFATSVAKVRKTTLMFKQNQLLRQHALAPFAPLVAGISRDPAMLVYLDSNRNVKAAPNENYAREVMELFTLGVGHYTETDIRNAARAFTGWHTDASQQAFEFNAAEHDTGAKTVLGQTGPFDGDDVLRILLDQPACARFLVRKLYRFLVSEIAPPAALLEPLAEQYRASQYHTGELVRTILRSRLFFSAHAYRQRIKSPVEYVLGAIRATVPGPVPPINLVTLLENMGQQLFAPPNVKGWTGGRNWLTHATLLARNNFADNLASGTWTERPRDVQFGVVAVAPAEAPMPESPEAPVPDPKLDSAAGFVADGAGTVVERIIAGLLAGELPAAARTKLVDYVGTGAPQNEAFRKRVRAAVHAVLCAPEYQLA